MSVAGLAQANGADLLQMYQQATGQSALTGRPQSTSKMLKEAVQEAKMSEASVAGGGDPLSTGTLLNTYA